MNKLLVIVFWLALVSSNACTDVLEIKDPIIPPIVFNDTLRFASYNVSMFGSSEGLIATQMESANQFIRFIRLATVIQKVRPDVLVLMEFDYDNTGNSLQLFNDLLLKVGQDGNDSLNYKYLYQIPSNTGELSGFDLNNNNTVALPDDGYGFGAFPGQYASAILSKYPLDIQNARTFKNFLWKDMPNAALPKNADGSSYYKDGAEEAFRLSSKNHIDLPILLPDGRKIHALISHPTPPVFDGQEDRNGKRNHDEIRLWSDYVAGETYMVDDNNVSGGLGADQAFIVFGDLNADPVDGDSYQSAISQLLDNARVHQEVARGSLVPESKGGAENNKSNGDIGDPGNDTAFFGLRADYVLPSKDLNPIASGVFWPGKGEDGELLVKNGAASDHLLVWIDIAL